MYGYEYEHTDCLGTENSAIFKLKAVTQTSESQNQ